MGAGPLMPYPKWVWTPAGGYYCHPTHWKRNTAILGVGYFLFMCYVFRHSAENERRLNPPKNGPIPSQSWCTHAADDDPRLRN